MGTHDIIMAPVKWYRRTNEWVQNSVTYQWHCNSKFKANRRILLKKVGGKQLMVASIIQDSSDEWAKESATMDQVYRNGICNIAACEATNSHQGIFINRNAIHGSPITVNRSFSDREIVFTLLPDWIRWTRRQAPLYKRGWVLKKGY
ncbi:hypothetical protein BDV96DRAFT_639371 [Lophiotrema nucula]|uniref:Heterokaryon incompatibility domain-containing protein n=1 Tax=Lophiotrema nucula TaxID=690887 RepID=A0A6A5ZTK6_9PLEO|nr:hypothetical protein BDV96DRAFT_639371 [Lophiotrema nucula]